MRTRDFSTVDQVEGVMVVDELDCSNPNLGLEACGSPTA